MQSWLIWMGVGLFLMLSELLIPGGIVVFLGVSAMIVSGAVYLGWITTATNALIAWFIISIVFMFTLRSLFMKYFEGDSEVQEVDEKSELIGKEVTVIEEISLTQAGRVRMRETTWTATSDHHFSPGDLGVVESIEGNILKIKK